MKCKSPRRTLLLVPTLFVIFLLGSFTLAAGPEQGTTPLAEYFGQPAALPAGSQYELARLPDKGGQADTEKQHHSGPESSTGSHPESSVGTWFQGGHTGAWYNPAQDGHGLFVEILPDPTVATGMQAFAAWYTYLNGRQAWIIGQGPVVRESNRHRAYLDAYIYEGADFPPYFDPARVIRNDWGSLTLQFNGCDAADFSWSTSYPGFSSGQMALQRLTTVYGSTCDPNLGGDSGQPPPPPPTSKSMQVNVENRLLKDIQVFQNGVSIGVVPALETRGDTFNVATGDQFSFQTIQDFGDHMEGIYPAIQDLSSSQVNYLANNVIGSSWFFIPYITNNTSLDKLLGVNMGLQSENRCNCIIPAYTANVVPGYYRLFTNSNLRLYEAGSSYTGGYTYWDDFSSYAQEDTGRINFTLN